VATKFYDISGTDLDDVFELAPDEAHSVHAKLNGILWDPVGNERVISFAANQFVTDNAPTDLFKRYLWKDFGAVGTGGAGFDGAVQVSAVNVSTGQPTGSSRYEYIELRDYMAAKGSAGGEPTWASTSVTTAGSFTFPYTGGQSSSRESAYFHLSRPATVVGFPVLSYSIVGTPSLVETGGSSADANMLTNYPTVSSTGYITVGLDLFGIGGGDTTFTVVVVTKATNVAGDSVNATTTFLITVSRTGNGGGDL